MSLNPGNTGPELNNFIDDFEEKNNLDKTFFI